MRTKMNQTAIWLPRDMQERLKKAGGERGLGEEIRRRLQLSLDRNDEPTLEPKLELSCTFMECTTVEAVEYAKELVEKARETGRIIDAKLSLPQSRIDLT